MNAAPVSVHETHIGVVFLVGQRAYKLKKPIRTPFLDFSTPELRLAVCRREVELNRRICPDTYLGVDHVTDDNGVAVDHMIVMRRMPEERRLSTLLNRVDPLLGPRIDAIARTVAAFHGKADRSTAIDEVAGRSGLARRWSDNIDELRALGGLDPELLDEIEDLSTEFLVGREPLFASRSAAGRMVDGHGDLLADDIFCLDDGPRILDCLEFDDGLRWVDGLDDICFLAMDLERRGGEVWADRLLTTYCEHTADPAPMALRHHYIAYRALVRAKVAAIRAAQGDLDALQRHQQDANRCRDHLRAGEVRLILIGGPPGSGKSTVAGAVADQLGCTLLATDRIRIEMQGDADRTLRPDVYGEGRYRPDRRALVYSEMLHRAQLSLRRGESVVLDASWGSAVDRGYARDVAAAAHVRTVEVLCNVDVVVAAHRVAAREVSLSDASAEVATAMAGLADPWPESRSVSTEGSLSSTLDAAVRLATERPHLPRSTTAVV